jgi:hypothetical protein
MAYAVLRCAKVKANGVSTVHNHNLRKYENQSAENINFDRNENLLVLGSADTHQKLKENLSNLESKKALRKDANVLLEFVFSASPEFFYDNLDKEKFDKWTMKENKNELDKLFNENLNRKNLETFQKSVVDFVNSKPEFKNNVVNLVLHLDEKTPHFHLTLTPILEKRLTAKTFFTPEKARQWQDDFHSVLQQNNIVLERGKEFSPAIHQTLNEYRSNEVVALPEPPGTLVPGMPLPSEIGTKVPLTDKVLTTKAELLKLEKEIKQRENAQKEKYDFYKNFYNETKPTLKKAKQALKENEILKTKNQKLQKENFDMNYKQKKISDERLEDLRQIPLVQVAEKLGLKPTEKSGDYVRYKYGEMNLVINESKNQYVDNKSEKSGFGSINFLRDFANYDFKQAVEFLGNDFPSVDIARELKHSKERDNLIHSAVVKEIAELPKEQPLNTRNITRYLTETRAIEPALVQELLDSKRLYADKLNNCVFTNENNNFAYVRGTHAEKRFVANKGQMDFIKHKNTNEPEQIFLFESVIDLLSYRTLNPDDQGIFVSIQGSAMANRFNELELNKYKTVVCCFDNDDQGKRFDEKVKEIFPNAIVKKSNEKDFNDDLLAKKWKTNTQVKEQEIQKPVERIQKTKLAFGKKQNKGLSL